MLPDGHLLWDDAALDALHANRRDANRREEPSTSTSNPANSAASATSPAGSTQYPVPCAQYPVPSPAGSTAGGLLLVHSHRHDAQDFALLARIIAVSSQLPLGSFSNRTLGLDPMLDAQGVLHGLSLLIINNDARWQATPRDSADHPAGWLRLFDQPAMRLRMLLLEPMNAGYYCGEFLSLSSAVKLTNLFPWVICLR